MFETSNLAGVARVAFEAQTGEANRDIAALEANYRRATGQMSDATIKLELAQQRLQRQIARGPGNYQALARAELQVRRAEQELANEARRSTAAIQQEERAVGRLARGAVAGSGVMHGLGRSVAFASTSFLGGAGLVYAIRTSIKAATDQEAILANLKNALDVAGVSWDDNRDKIEKNTVALKRLSAFDDEELYKSLQILVRGTGNVTTALKLNATAADIARARNKDLTSVAVALAKATAGQETALRRLVPGLDQNAHGYKLVEEAARKSAGAAKAYADTAAGAQDRFRIGIEDTEKAIGRGLLPAFTQLANKAADWLNDSKHQQQVQRDVTKAVKEGAAVARGLAHGIELIHDATAPLVKVLGGLDKAIEAVFVLGMARKVARAAGSFGILTASSDAARTKVVADAAAMERALDAATRPRNIVITETVRGSGGGGGRGGVIKGVAGTFGRGAAGLASSLIVTAGAIQILDDATRRPADNVIQREIYDLARVNPKAAKAYAARYGYHLSDDDIDKIRALRHFQYPLIKPGAQASPILNPQGAPKPIIDGSKPSRAPRARNDADVIRDRDGRQPPPVPIDRASQIQLQLDRTEGTSGAARVAALRARSAFDDKYILIQERLLRTDRAHYKQHAEILGRLYAERKAAQAELDQIASDAARAEQAAARKRAEAESRRQRQYAQGVTETTHRLQAAVKDARTPAGRKRAQDALVGFLKREIEDAKLTRAQREHYRQLLRAERQRERKEAADDVAKARTAKEQKLKDAVTLAEIAVEKATKGTAAYDKALAAEKRALQAEIRYYEQRERQDTGAARARDRAAELAARKRLTRIGKTSAAATVDVAAQQRDFLANFQNIVGQYASNFFTPPPPSGEMHPLYSLMHTLVHVNRAQLDEMARLRQGARFPESDYLRSTLQV